MLVGAVVGASFVLLLVVCEATSGFLWHDGGGGHEKTFYCAECDLRYARHTIRAVGSRICREGHLIRSRRGFPWIPALITTCLTFIAITLVRLATGLGGP